MSDFKGEVVYVTPTQSVSDKFKKRDITLKSEGEYPQYVTFQLTQDKCDLANNLNVGDVVDLKYNLRGRQWQGPDGTIKYFNTIEAWTMTLSSGGKQVNKNNEGTDDLPF